MSETPSDTLFRLRAADPFPADHDRGHGAAAQAALERILNGDAPASKRARRWSRFRLPRGGVGVALAVLCLGGGAAVAATNPFGWWSSSPTSAEYGVDGAIHVRTPTQQQIVCHTGDGALVCRAGGSGQRYDFLDRVQLPGRLGLLTRAFMTKLIVRAEADHRISRPHAARFLADLARVPDSFFAELRLAFHYATISTDDSRIPPPGVPEYIVCQDSGSVLSCQNLNGDARAPVGAGIYGAEPARDWRPAPKSPRYSAALPPGIHFTTAEYRVLFDLGRFGAIRSGSASRPKPISGR